MYTFVKRRTLHIWIAMLAVLFSALAPAVSHALAATASPLVEMCTVDATAKASLDDKKIPLPAMHGMEHCPYCATHGGSPALPPPAVFSFALAAGHDVYPPLFYTAPRPLHGWSAASPRGPPALS